MKIILQAAHGLSPPYFSNMFINKNERTMKITQIHCNNLKSQKIMFNFYAIKMWNELPLDYKKLTYLEKIKCNFWHFSVFILNTCFPLFFVLF